MSDVSGTGDGARRDAHTDVRSDRRERVMARYQQRCDMWVWVPNGSHVPCEVGGYKVGEDRGVYRDDSTRKWHAADLYTGEDMGVRFGTRREAEAFVREAGEPKYTPRQHEIHRELLHGAAEIALTATRCIRAQRERAASAPRLDPEPVEVVEEVPAEAYADVDAGPGPEPEPERKAHAETRPERFRREFGDLYAFLEKAEGLNNRPGDFGLMEYVLMLDGERWTREHPRMCQKLCRWRGDAFTSDRELAALAMWVERELARQREAEESGD